MLKEALQMSNDNQQYQRKFNIKMTLPLFGKTFDNERIQFDDINKTIAKRHLFN